MADVGNATIAIQVDAFVFNEAVCSGPNYLIAPITQPNYSFLSADIDKVRNDVLQPVDLRYAIPPQNNSRLTDIGSGEIRKDRLGVYVHWILPTVYRTGETKSEESRRNLNTQETGTVTTPDYKPVPDRWLIIRRIKAGTKIPANADIPELDGWIVESDRLRDVSELTDDIDTQVDVSPYVAPEVAGQAARHGRDFIGYKTKAVGWQEDNRAKRIDLTVLGSSNQLFADYQPHNGNVFSIIDNFSYNQAGETQYLEKADASYFVFGWHADQSADPLYSAARGRSTFSSLIDGLRQNHIHLVNPLEESLFANVIAEAGDSGTRTVLWGTIHNVQWSHEKPRVVPAENAAELFADEDKLPISIGTGPLDALLTYLAAQDDEDMDIIGKLILRIQTLLLSQDDGVDEQARAEDELKNNDYDRFEGGIHWHLSGEAEVHDDGDDSDLPSPEQLAILRRANAVQAKLDSLKRIMPRLQWELFSVWWQYLCDRAAERNPELIKAEVEKITQQLDKFLASNGDESISGTLPQFIVNLITEVGDTCEPGTAARFHQQRDPTMLIAGMQSGWPEDHLEESAAAMGSQLRSRVGGGAGSGTSPVSDIIAVLPSVIREEVELLASDYLAVGDGGSNTENQPIWTGQPWCPLFLEWEAEYFHIPIEDWALDKYAVNSSGTAEHLRWGIDKDIDLKGKDQNIRRLDGRVLLLPQPAFSLSSKVNQLFTNVPPTLLDPIISEDERKDLVDGLANKFPYMSCPLTGLTNHLLTIEEGTHVKPNQREPGKDTLTPKEWAIDLTEVTINIGEEELLQIGEETGATPYADKVLGLSDTYAAFKPVTHGQMRFTKINIVDKFGQAISVIDQSPAIHRPRIYPCMSELYACQTLPDGKTANTVTQEDPEGKCQFIQLPPHINQPARLNAEFLVQEGSKWRPADDWENPIFGWMIVNYANYGLQVFLPDGRFYREVRLGGASGATVSQPWLPFAPPDPPPASNEQLDQFIAEMQGNRKYLEAIYVMILAAFDDMVAPPDSYAEFTSAIIGKPVAITNVGWSVELAYQNNKPQSLLNKGESENPEKAIETYEFPLKIGDRTRAYDGLVGYYKPGEPKTIYTHFPGADKTGPTIEIGLDSKFPLLAPFHLDPTNTAPNVFEDERNGKLQHFVALVDPFVPLHGYTGILPVAELKLPEWTVESALTKMTAFLHLGPVMATKNVPDYDARYQLKATYDLKEEDAMYPGPGLAIPASLAAADWVWLQPYLTEQQEQVYMALQMQRMEDKPRWEVAPYTAVEGFLQLKKAIGKEDVDPPVESAWI